jgi:DDE superfamily endonuclease
MDQYVDFLVASQKQFSGSELARVSPDTMAHDSVSRWLSSATLTPRILWNESRHLIDRTAGYLVIDDSLLDKPYAEHMALVKNQYSGKHHDIVKGIDLVNALWTDGEKMIPVDYRVYDPSRDGKTKNDHAREMLRSAKQREFEPSFVLIDAWFTSIDNLKAIDAHGWRWIGVLQHNRLVSLEKGSYIRVSDLDWTSTHVHKVWLKAYGFVLVSQTVAPNGDVTYLATNDVSLLTGCEFCNCL